MWRSGSVILCFVIATGLLGVAPVAASTGTVFVYPPAPAGTVTGDFFGTTVTDPYRWLEDSSSPSTSDWIDAESELTSTYIESLPSLKQQKDQIGALLDTTDWGAPVVVAGRSFWLERPVGAAQSRLMWSGADTIAHQLVDLTRLAAGGTTSIGT